MSVRNGLEGGGVHPPVGVECVVILSSRSPFVLPSDDELRLLSSQTGAHALAVKDYSYCVGGCGVEKRVVIQSESHLTFVSSRRGDSYVVAVQDFTCGRDADPTVLLPSKSSLLEEYLLNDSFSVLVEDSWRRGFLEGVVERVPHDYVLIEMRGLSQLLLNDESLLQARARQLVVSVTPREYWRVGTWYNFSFREDLRDPHSPVDGHSGFVALGPTMLYYHTYPKSGISLLTLTFDVPRRDQGLEGKVRQVFPEENVVIAVREKYLLDR